jgi:hypothetical protein
LVWAISSRPLTQRFKPGSRRATAATSYGGNYGIALALVAGTVAIVIAILTALGVEAKGVAFGKARLSERCDEQI